MSVKSLRIPPIPYAQKMKQKSNCGVLSVLDQDPSSSEGMNNVLKSFLPYVPAVSECGNVRAKTLVQGESNVKGIKNCWTETVAFQVTRVLSRWSTAPSSLGQTNPHTRNG